MIYPLVEECVKRLNKIEDTLEQDRGMDEWERRCLINSESLILDQVYEHEGPGVIEYDGESGRWRIKSK